MGKQVKEKAYLLKSFIDIEVQGKKGILIEEGTKVSIEDKKFLTNLGFYVYGVRHNANGTPVTMEYGIVFVDHGGYIVLNDPMLFPRRKLDITDKYYCLTNQYTKFGEGPVKRKNIVAYMKNLKNS